MIDRIVVLLLLALAKGEDTNMEFEISPPVYEGEDVLNNIDFTDIVESKQLKRGIGGKTDYGLKTAFVKYSDPAFQFTDDFRGIQKDFYSMMPYGGFPVSPHISIFGQKGKVTYPKFEYTDGAFISPFDPYRPYFHRFSPYFGVQRPIPTINGPPFDPLKTDVRKAHIKSIKINQPKYPGDVQTTIYGFNKGDSKKVFPSPFGSYAPAFTDVNRFSVPPKHNFHFLPENFKNGLNYFTPPYLKNLKPAIPIPGKLRLKKVTELPIVDSIPGIPIPATPILSDLYKPHMNTDIKFAHLKAVKLNQPVHPAVLTDLKRFKKFKVVHPFHHAAVIEGLLPSPVNTIQGVVNAPVAINFNNEINRVYKSLDYNGNAVNHHYITTGYENKNEASGNVFPQLIPLKRGASTAYSASQSIIKDQPLLDNEVLA